MGLGLLTLGLGAVLTNPDAAAYELYLSQEAIALVQAHVCPQVQAAPLGLASILDSKCQMLVAQGEKPLKDFIAHNTQRHNLGLASLYTTELPTQTLYFLGIFGQFYLLPDAGSSQSTLP